MRDNLRRYRAIRQALAQCYPTSSQGNFARHLNTLAALISGIVGSKSTQLPHIATKVPVFHVWRDKLSSITYSEALIFSMSDSLQSTDRPDGMVGQERCHFQLAS